MTPLVINELLTYSFNRFDIDDAEDLRGTLSRYYGPEAITTAKVLLWEKYSDTLQPANDRLHRSQQSWKGKHIYDIYTTIKCINKKYPCERELPVTFVAANLANIPTSTRQSDAIILNRLKIIEVQMAAPCTSDKLLQLEGKVNRMADSQSVQGGRPASISNSPTGAHPSIKERNAINSQIGKYERVPVPPSGSAPIVIRPNYSDVTARTSISTVFNKLWGEIATEYGLQWYTELTAMPLLKPAAAAAAKYLYFVLTVRHLKIKSRTLLKGITDLW